MNKKNILVLETLNSHTSLVITLTEILNKNSEFNNFALVTKENYKIIENDFKDFITNNNKKILRYKSNIVENNGDIRMISSRLKQLKETISIINKKKIDIIFINSIQTKVNIFLIFYLLITSKKFALTIHDYIFFDKSIKDKIFTIIIRLLIKKSDAVFFLGDYLKTDKIFRNKEKIYLNYVYNRHFSTVKKYKKLTFALLGFPDQKRDHKTILKSFSNIINKNNKIANKIRIIMPLKIRSKEIVNWIKLYKLEKIIKFYKNHVPENKYTEILSKSHYCIIPFASDSSFGKRRISASFSYGCAYMLPIIVPSIYFTGDKPPPYTYTYSDEKSLTKVLKKLILKKYNPNLVKKQFEKYDALYNTKNINKQINYVFN